MLFEASNMTFHYPKQPPLLQGISLGIDTGEILAILGPNGAGKTTLLKCLMGMLPLQAGASFLMGKPITSYGRELWKTVGYVPQSKNANTSFLVEDMVLLGRSVHVKLGAQPKKEDRQVVQDKLEYLGIRHLAHKRCNEISGGELQMVLFARTLAAEPKLLVMDEPESNLDYRNQLTVLNVVKRLSAEGMACVFNTHYPEHALRVANKAMIIRHGKSFCYGDVRSVVTRENIQQVYRVDNEIAEVERNGKRYAAIIRLEKQ